MRFGRPSAKKSFSSKRIEVPEGSRRLEDESGRIARVPQDLTHADPRLVALRLRAVEPGARERQRRRVARPCLVRNGDARRLDVVVPEHLRREQRHAERAGVDREVAGPRLDVVALDRDAARPVVVEVARVLAVVVRAIVRDGAHADPETIRDLEPDLGARFEAAALDIGPEAQMVDVVVARERVPLEREVRREGRRQHRPARCPARLPARKGPRPARGARAARFVRLTRRRPSRAKAPRRAR